MRPMRVEVEQLIAGGLANGGLRPATVHRANRKLVFDTITEFGPVSRRDLALKLGLSGTAVNELVSELIEHGLIRESGVGPSAGGRRPNLLEAGSNATCVLALRIGAGRVDALTSDPAGSVCARASGGFSPQASEDAVVSRLIDVARETVRSTGTRRLLAVGVAWAAPVDVRGRAHPPEMPQWTEDDGTLSDALVREFDVPVAIDNDANLGALAELRIGTGRGRSNLVYVLVHDGVGAGIIADRRLYGGLDNRAGELGHTMIDPGGERCDCGNFGCLETVVSTRALVRYWQDGIRLGWPSALSGRDTAPTASDIVEAARMGDQAAASGIRRVGELLGVACANLGYLFGPEIIVLGGPLAGAGTLVLEPIRTVAASRLEKNLHYAMDITLSHFGSEGPCLGAAVHAIDTLLLQLPRG